MALCFHGLTKEDGAPEITENLALLPSISALQYHSLSLSLGPNAAHDKHLCLQFGGTI